MQGVPWDRAKTQAQALGDELDMVSLKAGVMGDDLGAAFQAMLELRGASREGLVMAEKQTGQLATIAGVLGKSTEGFARELGFMEEGVLKVRGQLFQLLQPTGIFGSKTKEAAKYWATLTEQERIRRLSVGLGQVATNMAKAEPSFKQMTTMLDNAVDIAKERLGEPIMGALMPVFQDMIAEFEQGLPEIEAFAKGMSKDVARWVKDAARRMQDGFNWIKTHQQEISRAVEDAFGKAKAVVEFILAHKEEIAIAFGAKAASPLLEAAGQGVGAIARKGYAGGAVTGVGSLGGLGAGGGVIAAAGTVAAFAAAVAAWSVAIDQWQGLMSITQGGMSNAEQDLDAYRRFFKEKAGSSDYGQWNQAQLAAFEESRRRMVELAAELGEDSRAAGELADAAYRAHHAARQQVDAYDQMAATISQLEQAQGEGADVGAFADKFVAGYQQMLTANNDGAAKYIAGLVANSKALQTAFLFSTDLTADAMSSLAGMVESKSKEFAEQLRTLSGQKAEAAIAKSPVVNFNGGQTFKIQQDFRDQDPDRVAVVFQRDITRAATRRVQAKTASPFGG